MARQTSIETYHKIKNDGLLSKIRLDVYDVLFQHGPLTQMETCRKINDPVKQDRTFMPRFAELRDWGVIYEVGQRLCSVTGRSVIVWDVTNNLPRKPPKKQTKDQKVKFLTKRIENILTVVWPVIDETNKERIKTIMEV